MNGAPKKIDVIKNFKKLSDEQMLLVHLMIDELYFLPREEYRCLNVYKNEMRELLEILEGKRKSEKIHKEILTRDPRSLPKK
ncbi:MAG: hypothetical protein ACOX7D_02115 [Alphaproteobacteria bacterium]|jgi:hypothetical protein